MFFFVALLVFLGCCCASMMKSCSTMSAAAWTSGLALQQRYCTLKCHKPLCFWIQSACQINQALQPANLM